MKKVLSSLLVSYAIHQANAQVPPVAASTTTAAPRLEASTTAAAAAPATTVNVELQTPLTTAAATASTTAAAAAPATTAAAVTPDTTAAAVAPATTATPATTAAAPATTAAAVTTAAPLAPETTQANVAPPVATPAPTLNPYCPVNAGFGLAMGPGQQDQACIRAGQIASDFQGTMFCKDYSCCKCDHIVCGYHGVPCTQAQFGDFGAIGAKSIWVDGWAPQFGGDGASVECDGLQSCRHSDITVNELWKGSCGGDLACEFAKISVYNPRRLMEFQMNGQYAFKGGSLEIIIGDPNNRCTVPPAQPLPPFELQAIEINGFEAAIDGKIAVRNYGCAPVVIRKLECLALNACPNTEFIFEGQVQLLQCRLPGLQNLMGLPPALQACVQQLGGAMLPPTNPLAPPGMPIFNPITPGQPPQTQVPPVTPVNPPPASTIPPAASTAAPANSVPPATPVAPATTLSQAPPASTQAQAPPATTTANQAPPAAVPSTTAVPLPPARIGVGSTGNLQCNNAASFCAGSRITIAPENNWVWECSQVGSCAGSEAIINLGIDPHTGFNVEEINTIKFGGRGAGAGLTIHLKDTRVSNWPLPPIHFGDVRCTEPDACVGQRWIVDPSIDTINLNFDCSEPHYCMGCTIEQAGVSRPCLLGALQQQQYPMWV